MLPATGSTMVGAPPQRLSTEVRVLFQTMPVFWCRVRVESSSLVEAARGRPSSGCKVITANSAVPDRSATVMLGSRTVLPARKPDRPCNDGELT